MQRRCGLLAVLVFVLLGASFAADRQRTELNNFSLSIIAYPGAKSTFCGGINNAGRVIF